MNAVDEADADAVLDALGFDGSNVVDPYGPEGVGLLALDLEEGFTVTHRWYTDIHKFRSGKERRISRNDAPQQSFRGSAVLFGDRSRAARAQLARYAAQGQQFLLALPHEMLTFEEAPSGAMVFVSATGGAKVDWLKPGQRVACVRDDASAGATLQSYAAGVAELDAAPGSVGSVGGYLAPCVPVFLEPQQDFSRYPVNAEVWQIAARMAIFDFAPDLADLALGPITVSAGFDDAVIAARSFGFSSLSFALQVYAGDPAGAYSGFPVPTFFYVPDTTTMGDLAAALADSPVVRLAGTYNPADTIAAGDAFGATPLTSGASAGDVGTGATLTTYAGGGATRPVWDREIENGSTNSDAVHALTQIIDHGGVPDVIATADTADWGRAVKLEADDPDEWQWWKLFTSTVKGRQQAFWLPTWADDMTFVSYTPVDVNVGTLVVEVDDLGAWFPALRQHIQLVNGDGSVAYTHIQETVNNGDGTWTLTVEANDDIADVRLVSWLELCRFENDELTVTFGSEPLFDFQTLARAVQQ